MPVHPDLQGRSFPATSPYQVGRESVRTFAAAVGAIDPVSLDLDAARAAGHSDLVAPPTYAIVVQQRCLDALLAEPGTGIALERTVHGEQRFAYERPIVAGDELSGTLTVTTVRGLGAASMVTAETAISDAGGALVVTATSVLVVADEDSDAEGGPSRDAEASAAGSGA